MANTNHMRARFTKEQWELTNDRGNSLYIGSKPDAFAPYDLLLGALEGCLVSTFDDVVTKMRLDYTSVEFDVTGIKRDADVATLETCRVEVTVFGGSDEKKLKRAFDIATRYCSVYQTISQVADMSWDITFTS
jgi:putative redox protein